MAELSIFEELVASEAAVRADYIYRNQSVAFNEGDKLIKYSVAQPDEGTTREEVAKNLCETFYRIYDYLFQDSSQHHKTVKEKVCNTRHLKEKQREHIEGIFRQFTEQNYAPDGTLLINASQAPAMLEKLYRRIKQEVPLHNDGIAAGVLFVEMGRGDKWKQVAPEGIDFTRGESAKLAQQPLHMRFKEAFAAPDHMPPAGSFIHHPESVLEIAGMHFPYKKIGWQEHLVTETGHLVNLTRELRDDIARHLAARKPWEDFKVTVNDKRGPGQAAYHLLEELHVNIADTKERSMRQAVRDQLENMQQKNTVDGTQVKSEGKRLPVSLMCMDIDLMTGLRMNKAPAEKSSELQQLRDFMAATASRTGIADFADLIPENFTQNISATADEASRKQLRETLHAQIASKIGRLEQAAAEDTSIKDIAGRACAKLRTILPRIYEVSDKAFIDAELGRLKTPAKDQPHVYITQGGSGSGKSSLKAVAKKECGDTLVTASLDDARAECDRFWLYPATDNHNDDYKATEEFAKTIRDITTRRARQGHYNILIDGSGIPYEGRNDRISAVFFKNGYDVFVAAAQVPLFVDNPSRRQELTRNGEAFNEGLFRIGKRLIEELRAVPLEIVVSKHIGFPIAAHNAARDPNVSRFAIWDASPPPGQEYTLSYTKTLRKDTLEKIKNLHGNELRNKLIGLNLVDPWVTLPPERDERDKEHAFDFKVIRDNGKGFYRVEIITDMHQYINMVQKGLLYREAKCPEALHMNQVHCDVESHFQDKDGRLKMRAAQGVVVRKWLNFTGVQSGRE